MELFVGSTNPAKVQQLAAALALCDASVRALDPATLPTVVEDDDHAVGNARKKATAFATATGRTCISMDAVLLLPDLPADLQPGLHIRRIPGIANVATDEQVIAHYTELCRRSGGQLRATWTLGFAIALPDGTSFDDATTIERTMVAPPTSRRRDGFPLDSLQKDPRTNRYLAELTGVEEQVLWQGTIGRPLQEFVAATANLIQGKPRRSRAHMR